MNIPINTNDVENYEEIKKELWARFNQICERVRRIEKDIRHQLYPLEKDMDEQSLRLENDDVLDQLNLVEREELLMIQKALNRLESGGYGHCAFCGVRINKKRLEALPYTILCLSCSQSEIKSKSLGEKEMKERE